MSLIGVAERRFFPDRESNRFIYDPDQGHGKRHPPGYLFIGGGTRPYHLLLLSLYYGTASGNLRVWRGLLQSTCMPLQRRTLRLPNFDYRSNGAYSVTICAIERQCLFGFIEDGEMKLNSLGAIAHSEILKIEQRREGVVLDEFQVMPNHIHLIVFLTQGLEYEPDEFSKREFGMAQKNSLSAVIGGYKSGVSRGINELCGEKIPIWQARFHEHIIRHEKDLFHQRQYIRNNPASWKNDENNRAW